MLDGCKVAVLGLGTMGRMLARGLTGRMAAAQLRGTVRRPERVAQLAEELGIEVGTDNADAARSASVVLVSVKPRALRGLVAELAGAGALDHDPLVVSIAAGVRTGAIERAAADAGAAHPLRVVRAMPNTPCVVGEGMVVVSRGAHAHAADGQTASALFQPLGRVMELDEHHLDTVTGLSGSGPAFVYVIIEALSEGGVMMGLPRRVATELASQTVLGAARMVLETGDHPAALKDDVLTPAGCTISALLALEDGRIRSVLARGVQEAARAAAALGNEPDQELE